MASHNASEAQTDEAGPVSSHISITTAAARETGVSESKMSLPSEEVAEPGDAPSAPSTAPASTYEFEPHGKEMKSLSDKEARERWQKWNLDQRRCVETFRFERRFDDSEAAPFLLDFFQSPAVLARFHGFTKSGESKSFPGAVVAVDYSAVPATTTSMEFFDRISEAGITSGDRQYISKQLEDIIDGVSVSDKLRDMLLNPDSEHVDLFSPKEQSELLFRLFKMVVTGGAMCQYEDEAVPYLDSTKALYKDLLTVGKDASGRIAVQSRVYAVHGLHVNTGARVDKVPIFPVDSPHSVCWVVVDPIYRVVTALYHAWVPFW